MLNQIFCMELLGEYLATIFGRGAGGGKGTLSPAMKSTIVNLDLSPLIFECVTTSFKSFKSITCRHLRNIRPAVIKVQKLVHSIKLK